MDKPIFIICLHRTGSTLIKNMFNLSPTIAMAHDEMHFLTPWHKDFFYYFKRAGNLKNDVNLSKFLQTLFSGKPYGTFWRELKQTKIDENKTYKRIFSSKRRIQDILTIILEELALSEGKSRFGAKYPLHFSKLDIIFKYWPDSKVIHLVRDSRALCASKVQDEATKLRKNKYKISKHFIHIGTLLFFIFEYNWYYKIHMKYKNRNNYIFTRFEDIIEFPEPTIKQLCNFCEIEFHPFMMFPCGKASSHDQKIRQGFDKSLINKWRLHQSVNDTRLITLLTKRSLDGYGYH